MQLVEIYTTTQQLSTRPGGVHDKQKHEGAVELNVGNLKHDDWVLVTVMGVCEDGTEVELSKVIVRK